MITWGPAFQPCNYSLCVPVCAVTFIAVKCCYFLLPGPGRDLSLPSMGSSLFCQQKDITMHINTVFALTRACGGHGPAPCWRRWGCQVQLGDTACPPLAPARLRPRAVTSGQAAVCSPVPRGGRGRFGRAAQGEAPAPITHLPGRSERLCGQRGHPKQDRARLASASPAGAAVEPAPTCQHRRSGLYPCPPVPALAWHPRRHSGARLPAPTATRAIHYTVMGECSKNGSEGKEYITGNYL